MSSRGPGRLILAVFHGFWFLGRNGTKVPYQKQQIVLCSIIWLLAMLWTVAHRSPLSLGFPRQEYWTELPFHTPGDLPDPETELMFPESLALAGGYFTTEPPGEEVTPPFCWCHWSVFTNSILLEYIHNHLFACVYSSFQTTISELSCCQRDWWPSSLRYSVTGPFVKSAEFCVKIFWIHNLL